MCTLPSAPPGPEVSFAPNVSWVLVLLVLLACLCTLPIILDEGRYRPAVISRRRALQVGIPGLVCLVCAMILIAIVVAPTSEAIGAWTDHLLATLPAACDNAVYQVAFLAKDQLGAVFLLAWVLWVIGCVLTGCTMYKRGNLRTGRRWG